MIQRLSQSMKRRREGGFTLIELLIVIVILGILGGVVVFSVGGVKNRGNASANAADAATLRNAEEAYYAQKGHYATEEDLVAGGFLASTSSYNDVLLTGDPLSPTTKFSIGQTSTAVVNVAANADQWITSDAGSGPGYASSAYVYPLNSNMAEPLVIIGSDYTLNPGLASSWELIPTSTTRAPQPAIHSAYTNAPDRPYNNATWRFHIRQGVKFHDGTALDADDVIWSWRDRMPVNGAPLTTVSNTLGFTQRLGTGTAPDAWDSVEKIDQYTVDFTPKVANLRIPEQIGHPKGAIVPMTGLAGGAADIPGLSIPRTVGKHLDGSTGGVPGSGGPTGTTRVYKAAVHATPTVLSGTPLVTDTPVGTGPFKYASYAPTNPQGGGTASTVAYDSYWGARARVKGMNFTFLSDPTQRTSGLLSGQYDMAIDLEPLDVASVNGANHVVTAGYGQNALLYVNKVVKDTGAAPVIYPTGGAAPGTPANYRYNIGTDVNVRRAISLAMDRTTYVNTVYGGNADVGRWMAPPNILGGSQNLVPAMAFNAGLARTTLDNGGWTCGSAAPGLATACAANEIRTYQGADARFTTPANRPLRIDLIGTPDVPLTGYQLLQSQMLAVGIDLHFTRAVCNATPCAGIARSQMYNSVMWDLDLELPNQNDANPAFLPVLRMACLATNANFRFAPVDGVNGTGTTPLADSAANGGGSFPFGNNPCNLPTGTGSPAATANTSPGSQGPFDTFVADSNVATTQAAVQVAAANQMRILVGQAETSVVIPITGQYRIYGLKGNATTGTHLGDAHPSQTSQRWVTLTKPSP